MLRLQNLPCNHKFLSSESIAASFMGYVILVEFDVTRGSLLERDP